MFEPAGAKKSLSLSGKPLGCYVPTEKPKEPKSDPEEGEAVFSPVKPKLPVDKKYDTIDVDTRVPAVGISAENFEGPYPKDPRSILNDDDMTIV